MYKQRPFATERDDGCDGNDDGDDVGPRCPGPRGSWAPTILDPGDFTENVENVPYRCPSLPLKAICHPEWSTVGGIYSSQPIRNMSLIVAPTPNDNSLSPYFQSWGPRMMRRLQLWIWGKGVGCWVGRINSAYSRYVGFPLMFAWACGDLMMI